MVHARSLLSWATLEEKKIGRGVGVGGYDKKKCFLNEENTSWKGKKKRKKKKKKKKNGGKNIS